MALHPQCKAFLDQLAAMGGRPMHEMTPAEARGLGLPPELAGPERPVHSVVIARCRAAEARSRCASTRRRRVDGCLV